MNDTITEEYQSYYTNEGPFTFLYMLMYVTKKALELELELEKMSPSDETYKALG